MGDERVFHPLNKVAQLGHRRRRRDSEILAIIEQRFQTTAVEERAWKGARAEKGRQLVDSVGREESR